jgi:hypothetical protein
MDNRPETDDIHSPTPEGPPPEQESSDGVSIDSDKPAVAITGVQPSDVETSDAPKRRHRRKGQLPPKLPREVVDPPRTAPTVETTANAKAKPRLSSAERKRRVEARLKSAAAFGDLCQRAIDSITTESFKREGITFDWAAFAKSKQVTVYTDVVIDGDDTRVIQLPTGQAIAYHGHSLGLESLDAISVWLESHPTTTAAIGIAAVLIQHGFLVSAVSKEVIAHIAQEKAKAEAEAKRVSSEEPQEPAPEAQ